MQRTVGALNVQWPLEAQEEEVVTIAFFIVVVIVLFIFKSFIRAVWRVNRLPAHAVWHTAGQGPPSVMSCLCHISLDYSPSQFHLLHWPLVVEVHEVTNLAEGLTWAIQE
jgi:hypothetical protein